MTYELTVRHFFDASHQLKDSKDLVSKGCARLHGHTYGVIISVIGNNDKGGMVVDFKAIKDVIDELFDHRHINEVFTLLNDESQPTAENIARMISEQIALHCKVEVKSVQLCEGYKGMERSSWVTYKEGK